MVSSLRSTAAEFRPRLLLLLTLFAASGAAHKSLSGGDLAAALRTGGCVIAMRHASSPSVPPAAAQADVGNAQLERQLDEVGRASARAMGQALRRLRIPVGRVLSSPTYRALETLRLAHLGQPKTYSQLGDATRSMQADPSGARGAWLRERVSESPSTGTNTVIVTQLPNLTEAFGKHAAGLTDGEGLVFRPDAQGKAALLGRMKIDEWPRLAATT